MMRSFRFRHTHLYVLKPGCTGHGPQRLTKGPIILNETLVKLHRFGQHVCNDKHAPTLATVVVSNPHPERCMNNYVYSDTLNTLFYQWHRIEPNYSKKSWGRGRKNNTLYAIHNRNQLRSENTGSYYSKD